MNKIYYINLYKMSNIHTKPLSIIHSYKNLSNHTKKIPSMSYILKIHQKCAYFVFTVWADVFNFVGVFVGACANKRDVPNLVTSMQSGQWLKVVKSGVKSG